MKIRRGFISNSSSSSFIVGLGKIKDINHFKKYLKNKNLQYENSTSYENDLQIKTTSEILKLQNDWSFNPYIQDDMLKLKALVNSEPEISIPFDKNKENYYCIVEIGNDEGDDWFWNPRMQELDYNIDEDYFKDNQRKLLIMLDDSNIFDQVEYMFGADRNG